MFCVAARGTTKPSTAGWLTATTTTRTTTGTTEQDGFPLVNRRLSGMPEISTGSKQGAREAFKKKAALVAVAG